jgi:hypothetical protein
MASDIPAAAPLTAAVPTLKRHLEEIPVSSGRNSLASPMYLGARPTANQRGRNVARIMRTIASMAAGVGSKTRAQ